MPIATASQTIGPYWHLMEEPEWSDLTRFGAEGERIMLIGTVSDGDGLPVTDAAVELWQPSPESSETWDGFGRVATDIEGNYRFITLNVALSIFARGIMYQLQTRAYFDGEALNESDPLLSSLEAERRTTLLARNVGERDGLPAWRLDIKLQGEDETVFLDV